MQDGVGGAAGRQQVNHGVADSVRRDDLARIHAAFHQIYRRLTGAEGAFPALWRNGGQGAAAG